MGIDNIEIKPKYEISNCNKYSNLEDFKNLFKKNFWLSPEGILYTFDKNIRHEEIALQINGCSIEDLMNNNWVRYSVFISAETSTYITSKNFTPTSQQAQFLSNFKLFFETSKTHSGEILENPQATKGIEDLVRAKLFGSL